jgi:hypothetical protein
MLDERLLDELGLNRMLDRLTRVVTDEQGHARQIKFLLFENERAMTTPIGSHSLETARPAIRLE